MDDSLAIGVPGLEPQPAGHCCWWPLLHLCAVLFGFLGPCFVLAASLRTHCGGQPTACKSNCKNIATALEMYAADNYGNYPRSLGKLTAGGYLEVIPTCPAAGEMTYINYHVSRNPDSFRFGCVGNYHEKAYTGYSLPANGFPRYDAEIGLIDHP